MYYTGSQRILVLKCTTYQKIFYAFKNVIKLDVHLCWIHNSIIDDFGLFVSWTCSYLIIICIGVLCQSQYSKS